MTRPIEEIIEDIKEQIERIERRLDRIELDIVNKSNIGHYHSDINYPNDRAGIVRR